MDPKNIGKALIVIATIAVVVSAWYGMNSRPEEIACTLEAKLCPDGSAVGRTGPKCEFAPCPTTYPPPVGRSGIQGTVLLGPTCPVMRDPPDPQCADKPYATKLVLTTANQHRIITEFMSRADGTFKVDVPPGEYIISSAATITVLPSCAPSEIVNVRAGAYAETRVYCDTGIR